MSTAERAPRSRSRPHQAVRRPRRRQGHVASSSRAGEILGLIGPNGSGKSTVMKLIMGIERPDAGSVRINGVEVAGWPSHKIARMGVGIVFQHSRPLHRQTVLENIKLALLPDKLTRSVRRSRRPTRAPAPSPRASGLSGVLDRRPATLPFADLRKIEIAKAIARDPQVLLIDEPFAGLTAEETAAFSDLICELRDDGRAVLLVDHNVKSVSRARRPRPRHVCRRTHRRRHRRRSDAQRDRAPRLSRRRHRDRGAAGILVPRRNDAVSRGRERQRPLRQGAGAGRRFDPCPRRRIRLGRRPQRRRQDDAVQRHFRPAALFGRHPPRRARRCAAVLRRRSRAAASCSAPKVARAVRRHDRARKPRSRRPASAAGRERRRRSSGCSNCSRFCASGRSRPPARCRAASSRCSPSHAR